MKSRNVFYLSLFLTVVVLAGNVSAQSKQKFGSNFVSLEKSNPVPEWFKDAKFGIYFHWGVYSVPAFANEKMPRSTTITKKDLFFIVRFYSLLK